METDFPTKWEVSRGASKLLAIKLWAIVPHCDFRFVIKSQVTQVKSTPAIEDFQIYFQKKLFCFNRCCRFPKKVIGKLGLNKIQLFWETRLIKLPAREVEGQHFFFSSDIIRSLARFEPCSLPRSSLAPPARLYRPESQKINTSLADSSISSLIFLFVRSFYQ